MNHTITSKEAILLMSTQIAMETGLSSVNMRTVAKRCGVAVGSVYNYFPSKADLLAATVGMFWKRIFHRITRFEKSQNFMACVEALFQTILNGLEEYPSFFSLHSMSFAPEEKEKGRAVMEEYFLHIKQGMLQSLSSDSMVRTDAFDDQFTPKGYVDFIFDSMISYLMKGKTSCDFLLELIRRTIY